MQVVSCWSDKLKAHDVLLIGYWHINAGGILMEGYINVGCVELCWSDAETESVEHRFPILKGRSSIPG